MDNWRALAERAMFRPRTLANLVGVGLRDLQLFFHRRTGSSIRDWLNEVRLRMAAQRLGAGARISELVNELGYCDRSHFRRQFRQMFHCRPEGLQRSPDSAKPSGSLKAVPRHPRPR